ncbi:F0F1 ATP synthase subunit gamma [Tepidamorphus sp. 3E244]|uniref:F0F1 ATP synthase subunit gamma n=1 Tax=Tepidamorphus sp. 3E244 TaxID=3385498 RepID=UPI0038FC20E0
MPSLKDLRNRISSVKATRKITKAMQMVAAAKLRRAQTAADAARPYAERMSTVLANLSAGIAGQDSAPKLMIGTGSEDTHLLLVLTAERGLCGGFNANIAKRARQHALKLKSEGKTFKFVCVGRKGHDIIKREFAAQIVDFVDLRAVKQVGFSEAQLIADKVLDLFEKGEFDVCTMFYSNFKSVVSQVPTAQRLIPAELEAEAEGETGTAPTAYEYEPDETEILAELLPRNIAVQILKALLENAAGEQGARMSAMDNATRNAGEMIDDLTLSYNRQRQAQITKELIEIISGAEAL